MTKNSNVKYGLPQIDKVASGVKIMARIKQQGYKVKDVANKMCTTATVVYRWTCGAIIPGTLTLMQLAWVLDCKVDDLIVMDTEGL